MNLPIDFQSFKPLALSLPAVSTQLNWMDYLGAIKVRWGIGRDCYTVIPGLYKVGNPNSESDVFVSANYKLSFDALRKNLDSLNAWILVIDTKGINVWCAAGKGTFGTDNLVKSIKKTSLESIVKHRTIIVPQLGAVGVAAHIVKKQSGFRVVYGPVHAKDIKAFIQAGYKATPEIREMTFPIQERAKLIPVDMMYGKYKLLIVLFVFFVLSGLDRTGFLFAKMLETSLFPLVNIIGAYLAGIVIAPLLLPLVPFRAFTFKGAFWGVVITLVLNLLFKVPLIESIAMGLINLSLASFMTMNFTGSSTYTSLSGVKKEMKWAIPFQIAFAVVGLILFIISKLV
ncbi:MAG: mercury methylation corrinoid protein HgcA [Bacteroidia bacterium]|nr:mercury methylation corrinoid protein HgcA [Bacteroidia bacterium]